MTLSRSIVFWSVPLLLAGWWAEAIAQGNPTGVCVYNCSAPTPPPQRTSPSMGIPSGAAGALGAAIGTAIGRAISGQGNQQGATAPNPGQNAAAQKYLDDWAKEDPSPASPSDAPNADHGGLVAGPVEQSDDSKDDSPGVLRVINQTSSYVTVSVDGLYGCNTAGGTVCIIPVNKGNHHLRAVRTDTGASFSQSIDVSGKQLVWSLNGS